jgi:hypothetical protein
MSREMSIQQFIKAVKRLPFEWPQGQWIRWLSEYHIPGYYKRQVGKKRTARFVYNKLANPEMLLWIIQAASVNRNLVNLAKSASEKAKNVITKSAIIRKHVPWEVLEPALQEASEKETTHWLQYWKPYQIDPAITDPSFLDHSASDQLRRVKPGDTVWIVSVEPPGRLITLGPIHVEQVVGQRGAETLLGSKLWPADWHIVNTSGNAYLAEYIDLSSIAKDLRFVSEKFPQLVLKQGKVSGTQFQQMRKLTPESAELISEIWHTTPPAELSIEKLAEDLDDLGSLDEQRSTLVRREQGILRQILFGSSDIGYCGICGCEYPVSLLVAAHIKPRAECSNSERRDIDNLMPLCLLGCDSLFERGFIRVDNGHVVDGPNRAVTKDLEEAIKSVVGSRCSYWSAESKKYFRWRAEHPIRIK